MAKLLPYWIIDFDITDKNMIVLAVPKKFKKLKILFTKGKNFLSFSERSSFLKSLRLSDLEGQLESFKQAGDRKSLDLGQNSDFGPKNTISLTRRTFESNFSQPTLNTNQSVVRSDPLQSESKFDLKDLQLPKIQTQRKIKKFSKENFFSSRTVEQEKNQFLFEDRKNFWTSLIRSKGLDDLLTLHEKDRELELEFKDLNLEQTFLTKNDLLTTIKKSEVYEQFISDPSEARTGVQLQDEITSFFSMRGEQAKKQYLEILKKGKGKEIFDEIAKYLLTKKKFLTEEEIKKKVTEMKITRSTEIADLILLAKKHVSSLISQNKSLEAKASRLKDSISFDIKNFVLKNEYYKKKYSNERFLAEYYKQNNIKRMKFPKIEENKKKIKNYEEKFLKEKKQKKTKNIFKRVNARIRAKKRKGDLQERRKQDYLENIRNAFQRKAQVKIEMRIGRDWDKIQILFKIMTFSAKLKLRVNIGHLKQDKAESGPKSMLILKGWLRKRHSADHQNLKYAKFLQFFLCLNF